jgi:cation transport protein ChaC
MRKPRPLHLTEDLVARAHRVVPEVPLPDYLAPRTEADHAADVAAILASRPPADEFLLFAYGSLLWKPGVSHADEAPATARGWHRSFCMHMSGHRGTPDRPGLMMALDRGGQCQGVVLKLPSGDVEAELHRLVRREMPVKRADGIPIHSARWIGARVGSRTVPALAYVINPKGPSYAGRKEVSEVADILASSCGPGGSCAEYLYQTVVQLEKRGIRDRKLWLLQTLVAERLARRSDLTE